MAERFKQLKDVMHTQDLFQSVTVSDYLFTKCLLFAKVTLPDEEFRLYQKLFDIMQPQLVQPDIIIYLQSPLEKLQHNIRKRNRHYEQKIPDQYLLSLQETYGQFIRQYSITTLVVNTATTDFLGNPDDINIILDALEKNWSPGPHYLSEM
jgi:deoxyguanosine kinase